MISLRHDENYFSSEIIIIEMQKKIYKVDFNYSFTKFFKLLFTIKCSKHRPKTNQKYR